MSQEENITKLLLKADDKLRKQYETLVRELIAATGEAPKNVSSDELFSIAKHCPRAAKEKIDRLLNEYCAQMTATIQAGITQAILLSSNTSQMAFNGMTRFDEDDVKSWRKTTAEAFREQRLHNMGGLDLSTSVWNYTQQTKAEFELAMSQSIEDALKNGNSAEQLGRAVREKLNNPDMMYRRYHLKKLMSDGTKKDVVEWRRRVIGQDGKVRFIKEDLEKVGRGVYRSARQNGLRLAMTEINMAYNYANCKRWSEEPFVLGIRIRLSKNHPLTDICDELQGDYPSDFVFTGWHPRCRCSMSSILMDRNSEEWKKLRAMSEDEYKRYVSPNKIKGFPSVFNKWCRDNEEKLNKARKNNKLPYFVKENQAQIGKLLGWRNVQYEINQRKFQGYLNDQNYTNVKFNHENGAFMATHREHNLDRKKGWYETDVQKIAFDNGYSVILQKEDHTVKNMKNVEGTWNGKRFEIAAAETGTANNILRALKHCATKPNCAVAVVFFPENYNNYDNIDLAISKFYGLKNTTQWKLFQEVYFLNKGSIIKRHHPT